MGRRFSGVLCGGMLLAVLLGTGGCTTAPTKPAAPAVFTVYPQPPETPRVQYLTTIAKPEDVEPGQSALMTFLAGPPPPRQPLGIAYGLALRNNKLYLCDRQQAMLHVVDLAARKWDYVRPTGRASFKKNIGLDVDNDGTIFVTDTVRGQVIALGPDYAFRGALGAEKEMKPADVRVHGDSVYVADMGGKVRVYDRTTFREKAVIPAGTTNDAAKLYQPIGLDLDAQGNVYVSDAGAFRVQVYDPAGNYLRTVGRHGTSAGEFARNKGVAVDREGRVYAIDNAFQNVQIFDPQGRILMYFGEVEAGVPGHMDLPSGIIVDYDHVDFFRKYVQPGRDIEYLILVSNAGPSQQVAVYGFLKQPAGSSAKP